MSCILHIETSTDVCSVAVSQDGATIFRVEDFEGPSHAQKLGTFVDEALSFTDNHAIPFDAVAVSCGPGSYTGLRIGVSMAKGICYARDLKLIALPTLEVLCVPVLLGQEELPEDALLCPMIDARRMEVYTAVFNRALKPVVGTDAVVVDETTFADLLEKYQDYDTNPASESLEKIEYKFNQEITDYHFLMADDVKIGVVRVVKFSENIHRISPIFILPEFQKKILQDELTSTVQQVQGSVEEIEFQEHFGKIFNWI